MPASPRPHQRAEAKYNVTTEFPRYDLHHAAASGNLGLVEFALSHGQPINSVLNGVLPLHAACAGGSEVVVQYLIDEGADVNATQLPRRYSNDKTSTGSLTVGASGSTPLHFAAFNGHTSIVKILLENGAHPDRPDKYGITPEMLARENGWIDCANLLRRWAGEREGDLPPPAPSADSSLDYELNKHAFDAAVMASGLLPASSDSRRLPSKRSMDSSALHLSRYSNSSQRLGSIPPTPIDNLPNHEASDTLSNLNASIPNSEYLQVNELRVPRRPSLPHMGMEPASPFHRRPSGRSRRPRSAGTGAISQPYADSNDPKRLGTKRSLLGMFRKAQSDSQGVHSTSHSSLSVPDSANASAPQLHTLASSSQSSLKPIATSHTLLPSLSSQPSSPSSTSPTSAAPAQPIPQSVGRTRSGGNNNSLHHSVSAIELYHRYSSSKLVDPGSPLRQDEERSGRLMQKSRVFRRARSTSRSCSSRRSDHSLEPDTGSTVSYTPLLLDISGNPSVMHDSAVPFNTLSSQKGHLRVTRSVNCLKLRNSIHKDHDNIESAPPRVTEFPTPTFTSPLARDAQHVSYSDSAEMGNTTRSRGFSDASFRSSSTSPIVEGSGDSPGHITDRHGSATLPSTRLLSQHPDRNNAISYAKYSDVRGRGHSVSSAGTSTSTGAPPSQVSSFSLETKSDSPSMSTETSLISPMMSNIPHLVCNVRSETTLSRDCLDDPIVSPSSTSSFEEMSSQSPSRVIPADDSVMPMGIQDVSTHAKAKQLLAKAQRDVYESAGIANDDSNDPRIPLSEQLAALGEIIALERRFAQGEKQRERWAADSDVDRDSRDSSQKPQARRPRHRGSERKPIDHAPGDEMVHIESKDHPVPRATKMRRPHTAEGTTAGRREPIHSSDGRDVTSGRTSQRRFHHTQSQSTSATYHTESPLSLKATNNHSDIHVDETIKPIDALTTKAEHIKSDPDSTGSTLALPSLNVFDMDDTQNQPRVESLGVPLTRVATVPVHNGHAPPLQKVDATSRRGGSANKLARMGFTLDQTTLSATPSSSRSPSKARFGIKSLMQSIKGK